MQIELTETQSSILDTAQDLEVTILDPRTNQTYRLVREDAFKKLQPLLYDDAPWTKEEMATLAGLALGKNDGEDYSHYLERQS